MFWRRISFLLLSLLALAFPIEHKYDKLFRFYSLTLIPPDISLPNFFERKIYFYPSDILAIALFLIALFALRLPLRRFFFSNGSQYLWIVFCCTVVSIVLSPFAHYPIPYIRLLQLLTPILLFSFVVQSFQSEEIRKLTGLLLGCLIFAAVLQSVLAIVQYALQGPIGLRLLSEPQNFSNFWMPCGRRWIFDLQSLTGPLVVIRPSGTLPHANVLGGFLSICLLASYSFFANPRFRNLFAFLIPLQFFAMSLTFSRAALFSWALGSFVWLGLYIKNQSGLSIWKDRMLRGLAITIFASVVLSFSSLYEPMLYRGGIVNYNELAKDSDALRIRYQNMAIEVIKKNPIFGAGFHQLSIRTLEYTANDPNSPPDSGTHNIYLYLAAETGLISLAAFLLFILSLLVSALKTSSTPMEGSLLAIFIAFLFIGVCDFYPLLFQQGKLPFFLIAGLLAANVRLHKQPVLTNPSIKPVST